MATTMASSSTKLLLNELEQIQDQVVISKKAKRKLWTAKWMSWWRV